MLKRLTKMWTWMNCISRQMLTHSNSVRWMSTNAVTKDVPKNVNLARLVGTVSTDVYEISQNRRTFNLRTFNKDQFYDTHRIIIPGFAIESLPGLPKIGQKILVNGKLRTSDFILDNGKRASGLNVIAKQIYLCADGETNEADKTATPYRNIEPKEDQPNFEIKDQNHIELMAQICFDLRNEDSYSLISLALHYLPKGFDGNEEVKADFIPVFAYNESLRHIARTQLKRLDHVRVEGFLKYKACVDNTGKKRYKGYIEAVRIAKLIKLREVVNEKVQHILSKY